MAVLLIGLIIATVGLVGVRALTGGSATARAAVAAPLAPPPLVGHGRGTPLGQAAAPANPPTKPKTVGLSVEGDRLPTDSLDALPPIVVVRARPAPRALRASLARSQARLFVQVAPEDVETMLLADRLAESLPIQQTRVADTGQSGRSAAIFRADPKAVGRLLSWWKDVPLRRPATPPARPR